MFPQTPMYLTSLGGPRKSAASFKSFSKSLLTELGFLLQCFYLAYVFKPVTINC